MSATIRETFVLIRFTIYDDDDDNDDNDDDDDDSACAVVRKSTIATPSHILLVTGQ